MGDNNPCNNDTTARQSTTKQEGLLSYCEKYPAATRFVDKYNTGIKAATGIAFLTHYFRLKSSWAASDAAAEQHLQLVKKLSPIRRAGIVGLGWAFIWMGILTATTLAQESVHRHKDPIVRSQKQRTPWDLPQADKESCELTQIRDSGRL